MFIYNFDTPVLLETEELYRGPDPYRVEWREGHVETSDPCRWCKQMWQMEAQSAIPRQADDILGKLQTAITACRRSDRCVAEKLLDEVAATSSARDPFIKQSVRAVLRRLFNL